jgi:diketogulonate reductase-like aldo/keto reductase
MLGMSALAGTGWLLPSSTTYKMISTVQKRAIPKGNENIPVVGLGTWRTFDAGNNEGMRKQLKEVLKVLVKDGASVVDSSPMYGTSESVVGDLSGSLSNRTSLFLATKVWTTGRQQGILQMEESIRRMNAKVMDLMQVHNLVDANTHLKTLYDWKAQGKIRYIGVTHYLPSAYDEIAKLIKNERLDFIQCCYNISVTDAEKYLLPLAKEKGVAVLINRPFNEGALLDSVEGKKLPPWSAEIGIGSWAQFLLKYILSNQAVTCVIPGTSNPLHLAENIQAGEGNFPDSNQLKKMKDYFNNL